MTMVSFAAMRSRAANPIPFLRRALGLKRSGAARVPRPRHSSPHPHPGRDYPLGRRARGRRIQSSPQRTPWWILENTQRFEYGHGSIAFAPLSLPPFEGFALHLESPALPEATLEDDADSDDVYNEDEHEEARGRSPTRRTDAEISSTEAIIDHKDFPLRRMDSGWGAPLRRVWRNPSPERERASLRKKIQKKFSRFIKRK